MFYIIIYLFKLRSALNSFKCSINALFEFKLLADNEILIFVKNSFEICPSRVRDPPKFFFFFRYFLIIGPMSTEISIFPAFLQDL